MTDHFVGQDAVDAVVIEADHPIETLHLVVPHFAAFNDYKAILVRSAAAGGRD